MPPPPPPANVGADHRRHPRHHRDRGPGLHLRAGGRRCERRHADLHHPEQAELAHVHARDRPRSRARRPPANVGTHERHRDHGERRTGRRASLPSFNLQVSRRRAPTNRAADHHRHAGDHASPRAAPTASRRSAAIRTATRSPIRSRTSRAGPSFSTTTGRLSGTPDRGERGHVGAHHDHRDRRHRHRVAALVHHPGRARRPIARRPSRARRCCRSTSLAAYSFQPSASGSRRQHADVQHPEPPGLGHVQHGDRPAVGTPALTDVATFSNIIISVSDGTAIGFAARVLARGAAGCRPARATVTWTAPTTNTDGSPLTDLAGYRVVYGRAADTLDQSAPVNNPGLTSYTVENLSQGTWYFARRRRQLGRRRERPVERRHEDHQLASVSTRSRRASVRAWPSSASVASMGGDTVPPDTATRSGCATLPRPSDFSFASAFERRVHRGRGPFRRAPRSARAARPAAPSRPPSGAFPRPSASSVTSSPKKKRLFSAISLSVLARSRCASTMPSSSASSCE